VVDRGVVVDAGIQVGEIGADEVQLEVVLRAGAARRAVVVHAAVACGPRAVERAVGQQADATEQRPVGNDMRRGRSGRSDGIEGRPAGVRQLASQFDRRQCLVDLVQEGLDIPVLLPDRLGAPRRIADADALVTWLGLAELVVLRLVVERHGLLSVIVAHPATLPPRRCSGWRCSPVAGTLSRWRLS
jgi:hypothetical protein